MHSKGGDAKVTHKKRRLGLSVPESLYKKISDRAAYHGKTLNATCLDIFWEYFETDGRKKREEGKLNEQKEVKNS